MKRFALFAALLLAVVSPVLAQAADSFVVTRIRFQPRSGHPQRMVGGRFSGSITSATNDFEMVAKVEQQPADGEWTEIALPQNAKAYRFVKWEAPPNTDGNIAEIEFYAGDRKLTGTPFGTTGSQSASAAEPAKAFDGDAATYFTGYHANGQYVGLDLGEQSQVARPEVSIPSGRYDAPQTLAITCATPGAVIHYSVDGWGDLKNAKVYDKPLTIEKSSIVQVAAYKPGLADSVVNALAYRMGGEKEAAAVSSFHIGNSLTDTVNGRMDSFAAAGGHPLKYYRFTIPGAPTDWLWDHPGSGFGETRYAQAFLARAPLTHLVTQPFAGHGRSIANEAEYSGRFYDAAREHSPNVQHWLYVQWPVKKFDDRWSKGKASDEKDGKGIEVTLGQPATTWQEGAANHVRYTELVKQRMDEVRAADIQAGKARPVLIIPAGLALASLKDKMEAGEVPGMSDFMAEVFADDVHLTKKGAYLVTLVHYACFFGESPEGKVPGSLGDLTDEQARLFQQIAWQAASSYKYSGIAR